MTDWQRAPSKTLTTAHAPRTIFSHYPSTASLLVPPLGGYHEGFVGRFLANDWL